MQERDYNKMEILESMHPKAVTSETPPQVNLNCSDMSLSHFELL